ncbi:MAG TPA: 5-formyltetrahydrofolate cyclo-ligase [Gammaproteobacteria bacterium]|nr:5-formyltetrahydrofolate cyclo-ligase [Gammaproteobacteria bacterium]
MNTNDTLREQKKRLRGQLKAARAGLGEAERKRYSATIVERVLALPEVQKARSCFIFVGIGEEIATAPLIDRLAAAGKTLYVPKIISKTEMIACPFRGWDDLRPAQLGIPTPTGTERYDGPIDVVITPGLGFTASGARIGYGAGYYDRWFATHKVGAKIALAFEAQILPDLPTHDGDLPVDMLVTEQRTITVKA